MFFNALDVIVLYVTDNDKHFQSSLRGAFERATGRIPSISWPFDLAVVEMNDEKLIL